MVLCNLFWAGNYIFGEYVVGELTPLWITFLRWLFASLILLVIGQVFEKPDWKRVLRHWPYLIGMAILGVAGYNMILYTALNYTSPLNASLVSSLNPGIIVAFAAVFLRERASGLQWAGVVVSLLGVMVVLTGGSIFDIFTMKYNTGDILMLVACVMWTFYSIIGKKLNGIPPITITAVSGLFAVALMASFAFTQGINISKISTLGILGMLYITLFPSVCSFVFWNISVREIGATKSGIFLNLIPVFTAIITWLLGERITFIQIAGGFLVFLGVYLTTKIRKEEVSHGKG
jgi:drug/metabolite transporter (DMT)-like permease